MDHESVKPRLYFAPGSSSLAPHIALIEADADFDAVPLLLARGDQRQPAYLAVNPAGRAPALVVNGRTTTEVIGTLTWVAFRFPEVNLLPFGEAELLATAYSRMSWYASSLHVAVAQMLRPERFSQDETVWPILKRDGLENFRKGLEEAASKLEGPWVLGERYSVLDPYTLVLWRWGERFGLEMSRNAAWQAHTQRMLDRPAVDAALKSEREAA